MSELYSEIILDLYRNPVNHGELKDYDVRAGGGNPSCGDRVQITLRIENGKIADIKFFGKGCAISMASASLLTEHVKGKSLAQVKKISDKDVFEMLGGIIQTRIKCATLAKTVLQKAIEEWEKRKGKGKIETEITV
ncbi:MAG: SUF system NifU family Fe-S cluster assembly protein [Candidatus Diapherotrites archaeon]|nr:SUF system NifU family Fe-S cluster assembly protein [Candidatus Diapherotrites archaeon]